MAFTSCVQPSQAGQASSAFSVQVDILRPGGATSCTVSRDRDVRISCTSHAPPQVLQAVPEQTACVGATPSAWANLCAGSGVPSADGHRAAWRLEYQIGEYSTRTVMSGSREYIEMTISW